MTSLRPVLIALALFLQDGRRARNYDQGYGDGLAEGIRFLEETRQ